MLLAKGYDYHGIKHRKLCFIASHAGMLTGIIKHIKKPKLNAIYCTEIKHSVDSYLKIG